MKRYETTSWFLIHREGETIRAFHERMVPFSCNDFDLSRSRMYNLSKDQYIDEISYTFLKDTRKWYPIAEINWPTIDDPLELTDGALIIIPSEDQVK